MTLSEARKLAVEAAGKTDCGSIWRGNEELAAEIIATYECVMLEQGFQMARVPNAERRGDRDDTGWEWRQGWNACRAAMTGDDDG